MIKSASLKGTDVVYAISFRNLKSDKAPESLPCFNFSWCVWRESDLQDSIVFDELCKTELIRLVFRLKVSVDLNTPDS